MLGFVKELTKTSWDIGSVSAGVLGRGGSEAVRKGTPRQMEQHGRHGALKASNMFRKLEVAQCAQRLDREFESDMEE